MPEEYFFVSDLHIGGDEQSKILDFEDDFIAFSKMLVLPSSSMPAAGQPGSKEMLRDLKEVFRVNESGGEVIMEYVVSVYCGRLG